MRAIDARHLGRREGDRHAGRSTACWSTPGPQSAEDDAAGGARRRGAARDPADAHPLRPRRRGGRAACAAGPDLPVYVHERGAPHMADARAARVQRGAALRRGGGPAPHCGARSCRCPRRTSTCSRGGETVLDDVPRRVHARATPRTTSPSCTSRAAWRSSATSPACGSRRRSTCSRRRRRPTSTSRPGTRSIDLVAGWGRQALALTHFGRVDDVGPHLDAMRERLHELSRSPPGTGRRRSPPGSPTAIAQHAGDLADAYALAAPTEHLYLGARRYLDKRAARITARSIGYEPRRQRQPAEGGDVEHRCARARAGRAPAPSRH